MSEPLSLRGSGRTTRQLQEAPRNAVFIVHNYGVVGYTRNLLRHINRTDISVVTLAVFENPGRLAGQRKVIVVDHHAADVMTHAQREGYYDYLKYMAHQ